MDRFELLLANAAHLKAVPGRKTDVRDAEWIAELLRHGLLRAGFIPPRPERELMLWDEPHPRARLRDQPPAKVREGATITLGLVSTNLGPYDPQCADRGHRRSQGAGRLAPSTTSWSKRWPARLHRTSASCWPRNCATWPTSTR